MSVDYRPRSISYGRDGNTVWRLNLPQLEDMNKVVLINIYPDIVDPRWTTSSNGKQITQACVFY